MDVSGVALLNTVAAASPTSQTVVPVAPDGLAAAQFQGLMNQTPVAPETGGVSAAMPSIPPASAEAFNVGDKILAGLGQMSNTMQSSLSSVDAALRTNSVMGAADLLKAQLNVVQYSLQMDYVGKMFGGVTRSIDQLSKVQ